MAENKQEQLNIRNKTYIEMLFARREFNLIQSILRQPLPKKVYGKRKNGKKTVIAHPGSHQLSKWMRYQLMTMQKGQELNKKEEAFSELLKKSEKNKKGSIKEALNANSDRLGDALPSGS